MKEVNILIEFLRNLKVRYTFEYTSKLYKEHPHRNNLYGLSSILSLYGIENHGIQIKNKELLSKIDTPFITFVHNSFVMVKECKNGKVRYLWRDKWITLAIDEFINNWSGILLLAEPNSKSIEPNYYQNKKKESINRFFFICLNFILLLGFSLMGWQSGLWNSVDGLILIFFLFLGVCICFLLLQKQMRVQSQYIDKLCTLFKRSDCNNVLESDASKVFGLFSWSELGFSYFVSTLFICLLSPILIPYCAWINVLALPYTLWSIWYQKYKVKQWCPLCLMVMCILWILFFIYLFSGSLRCLPFDLINVSWLLFFYSFPFLITYQFTPLIIDSLLKQQTVFEMNNIKLNEYVFLTLLKKNIYYDVSFSTSKIVFGNKNAKTLITVLTNPHCEPCAKMHERIKHLLNETGDKYCVQYIFSSFNKSLDISNKMLISAYLVNDINLSSILYDKWFKGAKFHKEQFLLDNNLNIDSSVNLEFEKHEKWKTINKLQTTPTILINGYALPEQYKIEDFILLDL